MPAPGSGSGGGASATTGARPRFGWRPRRGTGSAAAFAQKRRKQGTKAGAMGRSGEAGRGLGRQVEVRGSENGGSVAGGIVGLLPTVADGEQDSEGEDEDGRTSVGAAGSHGDALEDDDEDDDEDKGGDDDEATDTDSDSNSNPGHGDDGRSGGAADGHPVPRGLQGPPGRPAGGARGRLAFDPVDRGAADDVGQPPHLAAAMHQAGSGWGGVPTEGDSGSSGDGDMGGVDRS